MRQSNNEWPESLPELAHFVALYENDEGNRQAQSREEYLRWVKRFYRGWALSPYSWDWMVQNAVEQADSKDREQLNSMLVSIGWRVSGEWAKDTHHRNITSRNLMTWGDALKLSMRRGEYIDLVQRISKDVDLLLAYEIDADIINFDRYFPDLNPATNIVASDDRDADPFEVF